MLSHGPLPLFTVGAVRVATGAALFACTNAAATALYRRGGASVVSLYVIRSPIVYLLNGMLVALQEGIAPATDVLALRTGHERASQLALTRSLLNAAKQVMLSVAFVYMTYADAFTVFKGVGVLSTIIVARGLLGSGETLTGAELVCGLCVFIGILLIAQPPALFAQWHTAATPLLLLPPPPPMATARSGTARSWQAHMTAGLALATVAGLFSALSGTMMRLLSQAGGQYEGHASPAMLFSFLTVTMCAVNGAAGVLVSQVLGISALPGMEWGSFIWPRDAVDWVLIGANCICTLVAHLATAAGYRDTRASMVAFLQLTELPWVYLLDITLLQEPTSLLASLGSAVVFGSALAAALQASSKSPTS